jgi:hypothetical protein
MAPPEQKREVIGQVVCYLFDGSLQIDLTIRKFFQKITTFEISPFLWSNDSNQPTLQAADSLNYL